MLHFLFTHFVRNKFHKDDLPCFFFADLMFWQIKPAEESVLDTLLSAETITLRDVLDDPYVLQEARNSNEKLLN